MSWGRSTQIEFLGSLLFQFMCLSVIILLISNYYYCNDDNSLLLVSGHKEKNKHN